MESGPSTNDRSSLRELERSRNLINQTQSLPKIDVKEESKLVIEKGDLNPYVSALNLGVSALDTSDHS